MEPVSTEIEILPFEMISTSEFKGEVASAQSPSDFYLINIEDDVFQKYSVMLRDLKNTYDSFKGDFFRVSESDLTIGRYVAVFYYEIWMRGCVLRSNSNATWKIFVLDAGEEIEAEISDIRKLKRSFLEIPIQTIPAKLAFLHADGLEWKSEATDLFKKLFMDKDVTVAVFSTQPDPTDGRYAVCLLDPITHKSIDLELHKAGLAVFPGEKLRLDKERLLCDRTNTAAARDRPSVNTREQPVRHPLLPPEPAEEEVSGGGDQQLEATQASGDSSIVEVLPEDSTPKPDVAIEEVFKRIEKLSLQKLEEKRRSPATPESVVMTTNPHASVVSSGTPPTDLPTRRYQHPIEPPGFSAKIMPIPAPAPAIYQTPFPRSPYNYPSLPQQQPYYQYTQQLLTIPPPPGMAPFYNQQMHHNFWGSKQ